MYLPKRLGIDSGLTNKIMKNRNLQDGFTPGFQSRNSSSYQCQQTSNSLEMKNIFNKHFLIYLISLGISIVNALICFVWLKPYEGPFKILLDVIGIILIMAPIVYGTEYYRARKVKKSEGKV